MRTANEILKLMMQEMPFIISEQILPYITEAIELSQIEAYNEALDDAAEKAFIRKYKNYTGRSEWDWEHEVNKQSILKLKK